MQYSVRSDEIRLAVEASGEERPAKSVTLKALEAKLWGREWFGTEPAEDVVDDGTAEARVQLPERQLNSEQLAEALVNMATDTILLAHTYTSWDPWM